MQSNEPDMQDTSEDDADNALEQACKNVCDWVEENEAAIKITVGTAVIAATGAATVATGGATAKNFLGATIGGVAGGLLHMLFADEDEKTEGFADGYLLGTAAGATSPSIASLVSSLKNASPLLSNPAVLASIEGFLETAVEEFVLILEGKDVSLASVGVDFLINCFTSGYNPQMDKLGKGMEKVAKKLGKWFEDTVEKGKKLIDDLTGNDGKPKKKTKVESEGGINSSKMDLDDLPQNVQDAFKKYDDAGWQGNVSGQTQGTNAGRKWGNRDGQLPTVDADGNSITYREFDVNNYNGISRDGERFIVGSDGSVWYTDSHYGQGESLNGIADFVKIK